SALIVSMHRARAFWSSSGALRCDGTARACAACPAGAAPGCWLLTAIAPMLPLAPSGRPRAAGGRYSPGIVSEQFCDVGGGVTLCYETFGEPAHPTALLVMGLGTQMIGWNESFCRQLASRDLHVVRFDNRDIGRSTHWRGAPP